MKKYPRREGHVIVIIKPHYSDVSFLPKELGGRVMNMLITVTNALKEALNANKVYWVTMCDEGTTQLHFQLIPNYKGMQHGSKVLVNERQIFVYDKNIVKKVRELVRKNYNDFNM